MRTMCALAAIAALLILFGADEALADCYHNGELVPEGTRIGSLVCENGQWVERP